MSVFWEMPHVQDWFQLSVHSCVRFQVKVVELTGTNSMLSVMHCTFTVCMHGKPLKVVLSMTRV